MNSSIGTSDFAIEFEAPHRRGIRKSRRQQLNSLILLIYAAWAAALTVHGQPVLGPIAAVVLLELALANYRVAKITGGVISDPALAARVAPLLQGICEQAACLFPRVELRNDAIRTAAVIRRRDQAILILSGPLIEKLDDEELRALLAHEVTHLVHDDLALIRRGTAIALLGGVALIAACAVITRSVEDIPIFLAAGIIGSLGAAMPIRMRCRRFETRADLEGAALAGNPRALARALTLANHQSDETRLHIHGQLPWRWLLLPLSWRVPSHPPIDTRVARLEELAAEDQHRATPQL
jgi:heat shock protein HtpX